MSWISPIYDRVLSDVTTPTAKGLFNVADWERIYNNAELMHTSVGEFLGIEIPFDTITSPTTSTIPSAGDINTLLTNINRIITAFNPFINYSINVLRCNWLEGNANSPNYENVNDWEYALYAIHEGMELLSDEYITLADFFTIARAAGTVNGTVLDSFMPTLTTRTVVDTDGKLSIGPWQKPLL